MRRVSGENRMSYKTEKNGSIKRQKKENIRSKICYNYRAAKD